MDPVIITAAARDRDNVASVCIALGRKLSSDRGTLTTFVSPQRAARLVDDVREHGAIAAVFCEPPSHRTLQVKGDDAMVRGADDGDCAAYRYYVGALIPPLERFGHTQAYTRTMLSLSDSLMAIVFTPSAAFLQTPGPRAGTVARGGDIPEAGR